MKIWHGARCRHQSLRVSAQCSHSGLDQSEPEMVLAVLCHRRVTRSQLHREPAYRILLWSNNIPSCSCGPQVRILVQPNRIDLGMAPATTAACALKRSPEPSLINYFPPHPSTLAINQRASLLRQIIAGLLPHLQHEWAEMSERRAKRISDASWALHKDCVANMYIRRNTTLEEVRQYLQERGLTAT